jgi:hypothetical protein
MQATAHPRTLITNLTNLHQSIPLYSMNIGVHHFSTGSTWPRILPSLREFNMVTLQRASWP